MNSSASIKILTIAIVLFVFYLLQGIVYASGSIISQGVLLFFLMIGFGCLLRTMMQSHNPLTVQIFVVFYIMILLWYILSPKTVYGTINEAIGAVSTLGQLKNASIFFLSFFIAYGCSIGHKNINYPYIFKMSIAFFILILIRYFFSKSILSAEREYFTNNAGYYFIAYLPFIPIILKKHRIVAILMMLISIIIVFLSAKRGAILCLIVSVIFSFIYYLKSYGLSMKHFILLFAIICACGILGYNLYISNDYLMYRIENTKELGIGSRTLAYSMLWQHWYTDTNILTLLFGNGTAATVSVWGNYAHNDWLEVLINYGMIGVLVYLSLFIALYIFIRKSEIDFNYKLSMYICFIVWLLKTLFSMGYTDTANAFFMFILGIIIGQIQNNRKYKSYEKNITIN